MTVLKKVLKNPRREFHRISAWFNQLRKQWLFTVKQFLVDTLISLWWWWTRRQKYSHFIHCQPPVGRHMFLYGSAWWSNSESEMNHFSFGTIFLRPKPSQDSGKTTPGAPGSPFITVSMKQLFVRELHGHLVLFTTTVKNSDLVIFCRIRNNPLGQSSTSY